MFVSKYLNTVFTCTNVIYNDLDLLFACLITVFQVHKKLLGMINPSKYKPIGK